MADPVRGLIEADQRDVQRWGRSADPLLRLVVAASNALPRGRGAIPRAFGRSVLGRAMRTSIRTESGATLAVEPASLDIYASIMRKGGVWDVHVRDAVLALLPDGGVCYDIGANVGAIAVEIASRRPDARVVAFEPIPGLARAVALSGALSGLTNLAVLRLLLCDEDGEGAIFVPAHSVHASMISRSDSAVRVDCPTARLDGLIQRGEIPPPDVIKIDVEGAELHVKAGAKHMLAHHQPAIIFEADANMERFGYGRAELAAAFRDAADYTFFGIDFDGAVHEYGVELPESADHDCVALPPRFGPDDLRPARTGGPHAPA